MAKKKRESLADRVGIDTAASWVGAALRVSTAKRNGTKPAAADLAMLRTAQRTLGE